MTLPPGLQAARESGAAWCTEKRFAELLNLIETMAESLEQADTALSQLVHNRTYWEDFAQGHGAARSALDKYRGF